MQSKRKRWLTIVVAAAGPALSTVAFQAPVGAHSHPSARAVTYLNSRLRTIADYTSLRPAADLAIRVTIPDSSVPTVFVGHGFANTGAGGAGWLYPPSVASCGVGQGSTNEDSVVTHLATGTTDGWGGLFVLIPPVQPSAVVATGDRLWLYPLTPGPTRTVVLTSERLCGFKVSNVPAALPSADVGNAVAQARWLTQAVADGWHVTDDVTTRWSSGGSLAVKERAGATVALSVPVGVPVMVVQFFSLLGTSPGPQVNVFDVIHVTRALTPQQQ